MADDAERRQGARSTKVGDDLDEPGHERQRHRSGSAERLSEGEDQDGLPDADEGPFLREERLLLKVIAALLSALIPPATQARVKHPVT